MFTTKKVERLYIRFCMFRYTINNSGLELLVSITRVPNFFPCVSIDKEETSGALHVKRWALLGSHFWAPSTAWGIMCWWEVDEQLWQEDPCHAMWKWHGPQFVTNQSNAEMSVTFRRGNENKKKFIYNLLTWKRI